jgi:hypothetical protein
MLIHFIKKNTSKISI